MVGAVQGVTHALGQLLRRQLPIRLDHPLLGVQPLRLNRVELRALNRQRADDQAHPFPGGLDADAQRTAPAAQVTSITTAVTEH